MTNVLLDRFAIGQLIPHEGAMCLLDAVLSWDKQSILCCARSHRDPHHPLAIAGHLAALHLIEYGAQAMAIHGGLIAQASGMATRPGVLALVREVGFEVDRIDNIEADLDVRATRLLTNGDGWVYEFSVDAAGRRLVQGRVAVIHSA